MCDNDTTDTGTVCVRRGAHTHGMDTDAAGLPHGFAVLVRYLGPTDHRGSRWVATADHPIARAVVPYSYETGHGADNARLAVDALVTRWAADWAARYDGAPYPYAVRAYGHLPNGDYAFIVG
jgi:hypothetical protein